MFLTLLLFLVNYGMLACFIVLMGIYLFNFYRAKKKLSFYEVFNASLNRAACALVFYILVHMFASGAVGIKKEYVLEYSAPILTMKDIQNNDYRVGFANIGYNKYKVVKLQEDDGPDSYQFLPEESTELKVVKDNYRIEGYVEKPVDRRFDGRLWFFTAKHKYIVYSNNYTVVPNFQIEIK